MIPKGIRLYTWVDVEEVLQQQETWPKSLIWARPYWDGLTLGIYPGKQQEVITWLAEKFEPRFEHTPPRIILESLSKPSRYLDIIFEETEETPLQPRLTPRFKKPTVLWPPYKTKHPAPLPPDLPPVVAFHSFKGGVGRTLHALALANAFTKKRKARVLLVDGDLEAPGLTWLLRSRFPDVRISFADLLALVHSDFDSTASISLNLVADRVKEIIFDGIYVLPAFRTNSQFSSLEIKPEHLIQGAEDPFILTTILAKLGKLLNVQAVIVDLRAGLSELSAGLLLDPRVYRLFVTTLSSQSFEGTCYLLELLAKSAPSIQENEPLPAFIISQVPIEYQKGISFLDSYERQLLESVNQFSENQQTDNLPDLLDLISYFDSSFTILPNEWYEVTKRLNQTGLVKAMIPFVDWLPGILSEDINNLQQNRKKLASFADKLIFAETRDVSDFLSTLPLRNLASDYVTKVPIAVIIGAKGAGKTYTFLQIVRRQTWQKFIAEVGIKEIPIETTFYVYPVLRSTNLKNESQTIVQNAQQQIAKVLELSNPADSQKISDYVNNNLKENLHVGEWRERWLNVIAWSAGFQVGQENAGQQFPNYLRQKKRSVVAVIDGVENLLPNLNLSSEKNQQIALRSLIQDVPEWLELQPSSPVGLVVFVRQDMVLNAVMQNSAQLMAKYKPYALKWSSEEALRLVAWIAVSSGVLPKPSNKLEEMSESDLVDILTHLWGQKLGKNSKEARSAAWVIAALSDFNGQIQARDLVRLLHLAARGSEKNTSWLDRLLIPTAIKGAIGECGKEKIKEIKTENEILWNILLKLEQLSTVNKQIPFKQEQVNLNPDELKTLEINGVILKDNEQYYMPEIFRVGLGFKSSAKARPRVLMLSRRARKWSG